MTSRLSIVAAIATFGVATACQDAPNAAETVLALLRS
jgi:hypothetical protein